jgi:hypothetical protein
MDLGYVAQMYAEARLGRPLTRLDAEQAEALSPRQTFELLWEIALEFTPRMDAINATPYSTDFDLEADNALIAMAKSDSFEAWDTLSAGAWRVLYERLAYLLVVVLANEAAGKQRFTRVPPDLDVPSKAKMVFLTFLLTFARTVDRQLLRQSPPGSAPVLPGAMTLRRQ